MTLRVPLEGIGVTVGPRRHRRAASPLDRAL
jgi:hypothetical protein